MAMRTRKYYVIYRQVGNRPETTDPELRRTTNNKELSDILKTMKTTGTKCYTVTESY